MPTTKTLVDTDSVQTLSNKTFTGQGQGTATIDFGAFPGASYTSLAITGQTAIAASSIVRVQVRPVASVDHRADEHIVDPPVLVAGDIVAGTGFTIHAFSNDFHLHHGTYTVQWQWS